MAIGHVTETPTIRFSLDLSFSLDFIHTSAAAAALIKGSLGVKLPTIWTDEKQSRAEAERRERLEERSRRERDRRKNVQCRWAKR